MTSIRPFAPGMFTTERHALDLQSLRRDLTDLNRQLATGRRSETLGGLGSARTAVLDMRAHLSDMRSYRAVSERGTVRLSLMTDALSRMQGLADAGRAEATSPLYAASAPAMNTSVRASRGRLDEALSQLNTDLDGQYLFAGRASDTKPVRDATAILDGVVGQDGLRTLIAERRQADAGDGLGRLALSASGPVVSLSEAAAGLPFGFKLGAMRNGLSAVTGAGPAGVPAATTLTLSGVPLDGEVLAIDLSLPDGSTETVSLVARTPPLKSASENAFAIDGDPVITAGNLRAALDSAIRRKTRTALSAASAVVAARDMMDGSTNSPPRRIAGPPFASATGFAAAGTRPTVVWYQGDDTAADPRRSQTAAVDRGVSLGVGANANEAGLRDAVAGFAVMAAETFATTDPDAQGRYLALASRVAGQLAGTTGHQVKDVIADLAIASSSMGQAKARHLQREAILDGAVAEVENPSLEELSAAILSVQTRLQASYQTTASIGKLNLADYL